jgi:hypothetical protein
MSIFIQKEVIIAKKGSIVVFVKIGKSSKKSINGFDRTKIP